MTAGPSFVRHGPITPDHPVVLSVPHAGRDYPAPLRAALAVPVAHAAALEDRHVDTLALAVRGDATCIIARRARAWIDLNRSEDERDPLVEEGIGGGQPPPWATKVRSGLGLVPRRGGHAGNLWKRRFSAAEIAHRIDHDYNPYHRELAAALTAARARFGVAVLLDIHSMPSPANKARFVIGDRHGHSAAARFVARLEAAAHPHPIALNVPYAGGHILDRHGDPGKGIHAIQLEIDRAAYLDAGLERPGHGFADVVSTLADIVAALRDEALTCALPLAAE